MLETILSYLWEFRFVIMVIAFSVFFFIFEREMAISTLYALMLQAKRMAKDLILTSGKEQEDWVVDKAKLFLPKPVLLFLPDARLRAFVRILFAKLKDQFDDGEVNNSI